MVEKVRILAINNQQAPEREESVKGSPPHIKSENLKPKPWMKFREDIS